MIGISIATKWEWDATLEYFKIQQEQLSGYPYGEYFVLNKNDRNLIFYNTGARKVNGIGANQFIISNFNIEKIIVAGTCAGIDDNYKNLDIFVANKAVQYDCTVKEIDPLIKQSFIVDIDLSKYSSTFFTGTIGTADKAVVMWKDYLELKENNILLQIPKRVLLPIYAKKIMLSVLSLKGFRIFPRTKA